MKMGTNGLCHMTKMAANPIYGKNLLFWNQNADDLENWYGSLVTRVLPNLFTGLTFTYFTARSNFVPFLYGKML